MNWPSDEHIMKVWAVPVGRPGPLGQFWQLMASERLGMRYDEYPIMGPPVDEEYALDWLLSWREHEENEDDTREAVYRQGDR